jgi:hypothetical protein
MTRAVQCEGDLLVVWESALLGPARSLWLPRHHLHAGDAARKRRRRSGGALPEKRLSAGPLLRRRALGRGASVAATAAAGPLRLVQSPPSGSPWTATCVTAAASIGRRSGSCTSGSTFASTAIRSGSCTEVARYPRSYEQGIWLSPLMRPEPPAASAAARPAPADGRAAVRVSKAKAGERLRYLLSKLMAPRGAGAPRADRHARARARTGRTSAPRLSLNGGNGTTQSPSSTPRKPAERLLWARTPRGPTQPALEEPALEAPVVPFSMPETGALFGAP